MKPDTNTMTDLEDAVDRAGNYLGEWAGQSYVEQTMLQHERLKLGDAGHPLQLALSAIVEAQRLLELASCHECNGTGILHPVGTDGDHSHQWIEKCDNCGRFEYDDDAAIALGKILDREVMQAVHPTLGRFAPFLDDEPDVRYFVTGMNEDGELDVLATGGKRDLLGLRRSMVTTQLLWQATILDQA